MMRVLLVAAVATAILLEATHAFQPSFTVSRSTTTQRHTSLNALWRHHIPHTQNGNNNLDTYCDDVRDDEDSKRRYDRNDRSNSRVGNGGLMRGISTASVAALLFASTALAPPLSMPAGAVSGGGLDYAGQDISGENFSGQSYKGKDFSQVIAKGTNFAQSNLQGCRFFKAYLVNADFSNSDVRGVSFENTSMDGANLKGTLAAGAYFSESILDVGNVENADFTDSSMPLKIQQQMCERTDLKGTNPVSGEDTRMSLMCLD